MKKFLTVLLALSVVFTYTVGTAFAATPEQKDALDYAETLAVKQVEDNLDKAISELAGTEVEGYAISEAAWNTVKAEILDKAVEMIEAKTDEKKEDANWNSNKTGYELASEVYGQFAFYKSAVDLENALKTKTAWQYEYTLKAADAQFTTDYAKELAKFDLVDMGLYSTTEKEKVSGLTYAALAEKYIVEAQEAIAEYVETLKKNVTTVEYVGNILKEVNAEVVGRVNAYLVATKVGTTNIDSGFYQLNPAVYTNLKTIKDLENQGNQDAADAATVKAVVQQNFADYIATGGTDLELAKAYVTVYSWLADQGVVKADVANQITKIGNLGTVGDDIKAAVKDVEILNAFAKKYAAEVNADGLTIRDKETIDKIVERATTDLYALATGQPNYVAKYNDLHDATTAIALAISANEAYDLAFEKEVAKAALETSREADLEDYYDLEQKDVNAAYDKAIAAIDAAKDTDEFAVINATLNKELRKIDTAEDVDALFGNLTSTTATTEEKLHDPAKKQYDKLAEYIKFANKNLSTRDDAYIYADGLADALITFYGENGARTKAEVEALADKVMAVVEGLPTVGGVASAKAAAEAAIAAIPAKVTVADKELVEAAWKAANKYAEILGKDSYKDVEVYLKNKADLVDGIEALHSAMALDLAKRATAAGKTDKAALKAVQAEIDAFNDLHEDDEIFDVTGLDKYTDTAVENALAAIKAKELAAVKAAILAIPLNITEDDAAAIEAARALFDAYVEDYTSYEAPACDPIGGEGEIGYNNLRALTVAEARLATIIADKQIKAVESLKIVKNHSVAGKGYIKIAWSTIGDTSAVDGYQIYRATKANGVYKYMFTTANKTYKNTKSLKKGTRYFYKVRAFVEIDGQKHYSDWSNKAYRIAK